MPYLLSTDTLPTFPSTLSAARRFSNLTQAEAAMRIGITSRTLHDWEQGLKVIKRSKQYLAANFIRSTGWPVIESIVEDGQDPKEYFIGRLATGPAFSDHEVAAALNLGLDQDYDEVATAAVARFDSQIPMSSNDTDLVVRAITLNATQQDSI